MLDDWQTLRQLAYLAKNVVWPDSPSQAVLTGGCQPSEDDPVNYLTDGGINALGLPCAIVRYKDRNVDPVHSERDVVRRYELVVIAQGTGDRHGSTALVGGSRAAAQGQGQSQGRGLAEVVGQLRQTFDKLVDSTNGIQGYTSAVSRPIRVDGVLVVAQVLELVVVNSPSARYYHTPYKLVLRSGGAGVVNMAWSNGPTRYDSVGLVARYASGSSAPQTPTSGLAVPAFPSTSFPTTFSFSPGAGTWSVSLFNAFDETSTTPTTPDRWSAFSSLASGTITV